MASPEYRLRKPSGFGIPLTAPADGSKRSSNYALMVARNKTSLGTCADLPVLHKRCSVDSQRSSISSCRLRHTLKRAGTRHVMDVPQRSKITEQKVNSRFQNRGEALRLFRKMVRRAIICLHWVSAVLKVKHNYLEYQLEQLTDRSKNMEQTLSLKQMELAGTVFNRQDYMPNREICLKKEIQYILTIPPESRSKEEITKALNSLQSVKSFTEFPAAVQYRLCQVAWYQRVPPRKVIIRQGHQGLHFYFVISGSGIVKVVRRRADGTIMNGERVVFKIERGSSFGDIALLHNVERTATVESFTEMSLLMISKDDFVQIFLQREMDGVKPEHMAFLKTVNALRHWPVDSLSMSTGNCIFHYFKRGKLIVADSKSSDFLYVVKSGSCEVIKQLKPPSGHNSTNTADSYKSSADSLLENLMKGVRTKAKVSCWSDSVKLPPVQKEFVAGDPKEDVRRSLERLVKAKRFEPNLMLDIPSIIHKQLEDVQKQLACRNLRRKPALASLVDELVKRGRMQKEKVQQPAASQPASDESGKLATITEHVRSSTNRVKASSTTEKTVKFASKEKPRVFVQRPSSLELQYKTCQKSVTEPISKNQMGEVTRKWKQNAAGKSDDGFKEFNRAKEMSAMPEKLLAESSAEETPSYSNFPQVEAASLMISHEGKKQTFMSQTGRESEEKMVFVRLGLLRCKDVFGLETLDFDANYRASDTSVCLVSRGAEVLMIRKKFFLDHCNSENLEHLRTVVCPYPMESSMQDNLQVSINWSAYCDQLISKILQEISDRKYKR